MYSILMQNPFYFDWIMVNSQFPSFCITIFLLGGRMTSDFTSFSTLFKSYRDYGRMIRKGCVKWNPVYSWQVSASSGNQTWGLFICRPSHWAPRASFLWSNTGKKHCFFISILVSGGHCDSISNPGSDWCAGICLQTRGEWLVLLSF